MKCNIFPRKRCVLRHSEMGRMFGIGFILQNKARSDTGTILRHVKEERRPHIIISPFSTCTSLVDHRSFRRWCGLRTYPRLPLMPQPETSRRCHTFWLKHLRLFLIDLAFSHRFGIFLKHLSVSIAWSFEVCSVYPDRVGREVYLRGARY